MSTTSNQTTNDHSSILDDTVLHEDDLTEQAKNQFGYHSDILRTFELYRQSVLRNEYITPLGRNFFLSEFHTLHTSCKRVLNYAVEHNEIFNQNLPTIGPLVVCGFARTGTTLLYNLLACDPNCRAPLYTDMYVEVVPPIPRSDSIGQKRRLDLIKSPQQDNEQLSDMLIRIAASHPHSDIEEDYHILRQAGYFCMGSLPSDDEDDTSDSWIRKEMNKDYVYDYHEIFLRMLNTADAPKSHWLLKSPFHIFSFDKLLEHYPNALLIIPHRRIDEALPSSCSLVLAIADLYFDKTNSISRDRIIKRCYQFFDTEIECMMKFRRSENGILAQSKKHIFDITYDNLMKDPIGVVHQIYDYFNLHWSNEMEMAMRDWLLKNPQGKQGRHRYSLAEFGFNREDIETRYADYINLFLSSDNQSSSTTSISS
ncbi:unnamed protein product [Rotaria sordida]|uniref:Sulfotransferase n=1 Tax=Rotaria sordida TaxID=392033 RepID=A0A814F3I1_9BILA|nr:unnamed protein product [Rotaria sordida]CAF0975405.1 unnamed protein product [Rotaria sordida]CAF3931558.1 unnamed protein product [Rotaria sordida]CAF4140053.1 unnamed protein product [Rotaria sordida]